MTGKFVLELCDSFAMVWGQQGEKGDAVWLWTEAALKPRFGFYFLKDSKNVDHVYSL